MKRRTVTVLIAARDEEATLPATLGSLARQTRKPERVIVVDDGSQDRTAQIAEAFGATVLRLPDSGGKKSIAQHSALPLITTDLVVTLDADTELAPDALEKIVKPFEGNDPPSGACGFIAAKELRSRSLWQRGRLVEYLFIQSTYKPLQSMANVVLTNSGCFSCWQVKDIRSRGGFASRSLAEDLELTMDILTGPKDDSGGSKRVVFVPRAFAYTRDPPTFRLYLRQMRRWYAGFFQSLTIHWRRLIRFRTPLSFFTAAIVLESAGGAILFIALLAVTVTSSAPVDWLPAAAGYLLSIVGIAALSSAIQIFRIRRLEPNAPKEIYRLSRIPVALLCFVVTSAVNQAVFFWSGVRELVLRRHLTSWQKCR